LPGTTIMPPNGGFGESPMKITKLFPAPGVVLFAAAIASAQPIITLPPITTGGLPPSSFGGQQFAASFVPAVRADVNFVRAWGAFANGISNISPPTSGTRTWGVYLFADNANLPGTQLATWSVAPIITDTLLNHTAGFDIYSLDFNLPTTIAVLAGTRYWVSVTFNYAPPPFFPSTSWAWSATTATTASSAAIRSSSVNPWNANIEDRAFEIIPAPGTAALVGLAGLAAFRRRR